MKSFTPYYVWPSIDPTYDVVHFLSTDESIQCEGYTFYHLDLGPRGMKTQPKVQRTSWKLLKRLLGMLIWRTVWYLLSCLYGIAM
jgi:hypothetical protein